MTAPAFRFAPSPNGYLHLGHAYSAALNAEMARRDGCGANPSTSPLTHKRWRV
jgi:glutamyl/glutaminyl-tRNA synthetase